MSGAAVEASGLGKRFGKTWALRDCTLSLPEGRVVALIGPNGAGKTTFLSLVMGLVSATEGTVLVGGQPAGSPEALPEVAFMAQDHPLYQRFTVAEHVRLGQSLNAAFDTPWARARLDALGIPLSRPAGRLSGGQQAQVALTLAVAKRARVLLLDEPLASLDPIARRDVMSMLMTRVAETGATVVFSSHVVSELERVCDYLTVMSRSQVQLAGDADEILARHTRLVGPGGAPAPGGVDAVIERADSGAQAVLLARTGGPLADPRWQPRPVTIEDIALGYLAAPEQRYLPGARLSVVPLPAPLSLREGVMTWLVWRQHRAEALAAVIVVAILAAVATPIALHLYQVTGQLRQGGCLDGRPAVDCGSAFNAFNATSRTLTGILPLLNLLPALAGVFIGAPLIAREIESGTWRLAWSQGVTQRAWLRCQLAGTVAVTALSAALFTAVLTWWLTPLDEVNGRFSQSAFDLTGVIPLAWALLAFALGVLAGTALRRVVPAMAVTLLAYAAIRFPVEFALRPRYLPAARLGGIPFTDSQPLPRDAWQLGQDVVAPGGHTVLTGAQFDQVQHSAAAALRASYSSSDYLTGLNQWLTAHGYTQTFIYQPADRFWAFQGIEGTLCLALALAATAIAWRLALRRPA